jgi:hypothetical protein
MSALVSLLVPLIIICVVAFIIIRVTQRFSPDPMITEIVKWVVLAIVLIALITKLLPLLRF